MRKRKGEIERERKRLIERVRENERDPRGGIAVREGHSAIHSQWFPSVLLSLTTTTDTH